MREKKIFYQGIKSIDDFIDYSATTFGSRKAFNTASSGLRYAALSGYRSYRIPEIPSGNVDALATNIVARYKDGIMLDSTGQVSNICNWAHAQNVEAVKALRAVDLKIKDMGPTATEYQKRTRINVRGALKLLNV